MDFIGTMEGSEIQVELKYCERCGGLWLRPQGNKWSVLRRLPCVFGGNAEPWGGAASQSALPPQSARARKGCSKRRPPEPHPY